MNRDTRAARNVAEFERRFASADAGRAYRVQLPWPDGFRCARCGGTKAWPARLPRHAHAAARLVPR